MSIEAPPEPVDDVEAPPPEHASLTAALAAAQGEFPTIEKAKTADAGTYTYSYADIADVLAAVRPVLSRHGLAIIQRTKPGEGNKTLLTTELRFAAYETEESIDSEVEIQQPTSNPQQFGAALTYLRRYELVTLLGIAAEEDRDAQDVKPPTNGNGRAAEIPAYAQAAHPRRRQELLDALEPLLGARAAAGVLETVDSSIGKMPDGFVGFGKLLAGRFAGALEATGQRSTYRRELEGVIERAARDRERRAAEDDAQAAAAADLDAQQASGEPEPPTSTEPGPPAAGTVDKPDLAGITEEQDAVSAYRELGCSCGDPLADDDVKAAHDDNCPIKGHGIPF